MAQVVKGRLYGPTQGEYQAAAGDAIAGGLQSGIQQGLQAFQKGQALKEQKRVTNLMNTWNAMKTLATNQYGGDWKRFMDEQKGLTKSFLSLLQPGVDPDAEYKKMVNNLEQTLPQKMKMLQEYAVEGKIGQALYTQEAQQQKGQQKQQQQVTYTPEQRQEQRRQGLKMPGDLSVETGTRTVQATGEEAQTGPTGQGTIPWEVLDQARQDIQKQFAGRDDAPRMGTPEMEQLVVQRAQEIMGGQGESYSGAVSPLYAEQQLGENLTVEVEGQTFSPDATPQFSTLAEVQQFIDEHPDWDFSGTDKYKLAEVIITNAYNRDNPIWEGREGRFFDQKNPGAPEQLREKVANQLVAANPDLFDKDGNYTPKAQQPDQVQRVPRQGGGTPGQVVSSAGGVVERQTAQPGGQRLGSERLQDIRYGYEITPEAIQQAMPEGTPEGTGTALTTPPSERTGKQKALMKRATSVGAKKIRWVKKKADVNFHSMSEEEALHMINLLQGEPLWSEEEAELIDAGKMTQTMRHKVMANNPLLAGLLQGENSLTPEQLLAREKFEWQKLTEQKELEIDAAKANAEIQRKNVLNEQTQLAMSQQSEQTLQQQMTTEEWKSFNMVENQIDGILSGISDEIRKTNGSAEDYIQEVAKEMKRNPDFAKMYHDYVSLKAKALGRTVEELPTGSVRNFSQFLRRIWPFTQPKQFVSTVSVLGEKIVPQGVSGTIQEPTQPQGSSDAYQSDVTQELANEYGF